MPGGGGEKTEKASPKKRQDERKKGNIFQSKDIVTIISILVSFFTIRLFIGSFMDKIQLNYMQQMERAVYLETVGAREVMQIFFEAGSVFMTTVLPAIVIIGAASLVAVMAQTRFLVSYESIKFKLERISPIKGMKRLVSLRSLVELLKSLIKIVVLTAILYMNVKDAVEQLPAMLNWDIEQAVSFAGDEIISLVISVGISFGAVAMLDFLYQRWEYEKNIRMSKQEIKDEYKQIEGNPEIKSARRQKQREFAQNRMMAQVKDADVVVRNPTHYAVALRYTLDVDPAPVVLAKGQDLIALKIIDEAEKHNISMVENKPLARGLYETSNIDDPIPAEFYQPVAELLAWLYSTKEKEKVRR